MSEFYNDITIPSFGYDFYLNTGFVQISDTINSSSDVSVSIEIIAVVSDQVDCISSTNFDIAITAVIAANIDISLATQASFAINVLFPAESGITNSFNVNLYSLERFSPLIVEDSFNIKPFFYLDGIPLSEHNRTTSSSVQMINVVNSNWRGTKSVYYKNNNSKKTFVFQWRFLPGKRDNTVDNNAGRDMVNEFGKDPRVHTLMVRNLDTNGTTPYTVEVYNVLITEYNESLVRRDLVGDDYYWDCTLNLQEA